VLPASAQRILATGKRVLVMCRLLVLCQFATIPSLCGITPLCAIPFRIVLLCHVLYIHFIEIKSISFS